MVAGACPLNRLMGVMRSEANVAEKNSVKEAVHSHSDLCCLNDWPVARRRAVSAARYCQQEQSCP